MLQYLICDALKPSDYTKSALRPLQNCYQSSQPPHNPQQVSAFLSFFLLLVTVFLHHLPLKLFARLWKYVLGSPFLHMMLKHHERTQHLADG